jgi:N-acetylglucosaminyl-diphospho-decaprenol L-rhamnosyltransferase
VDRHGEFDVVVVNWNTGGYLADSLCSVYQAQRSAQLGRVIVVDNASLDNSLERAAEWLDRPASRLLRNAENRGFGTACNQAAREGSAPLIVFLNPDARVLDGAIDRVVAFLGSPGGRTVGICGGRVLDGSGRPTIAGGPFPSLRLLFGQVTGLHRLFPTVFPARHVTALEESGTVDHVIGAFLVVRRDLFDQLGGFDERYFMYYEEVDLCLRARRLGWLTYHLADAEVLHVGNVSSDQVRPARLFYSLRSRRLYARQHWGRMQNVLLTAQTFTLELGARMLTETVRRRAIPVETVRGYAQFAQALGKGRDRPLD